MFITSVKKVLWAMMLFCLIAGWLVLSGFNLYCAISYRCISDASGWWSLFITVIGLPVVVVQLYLLRKTLLDTIREPKIEIGLLTEPIDYTQIFSNSKLPAKQSYNVQQYLEELRLTITAETLTRADFSPVRMVIANVGNYVAQKIKIRVSLISYPGENPPFYFIMDPIDDKFKPLPNLQDFVFGGSGDRAIFPDDFEAFPVFIGPSKEAIFGSSLRVSTAEGFYPGTYRFRCTVWADRLSKAISKELEIEITDSQKQDKEKASLQQQPQQPKMAFDSMI